MTDKVPADWILIEAAKRSEYPHEPLGLWYLADTTFRALCDMIERYEQPPVDRKVLCAREAITQSHDENFRSNICQWEWIAIRAIEIYEGGFGK